MKTIRKHRVFASALIGLLVLATCKDPLEEPRVRSNRMENRSLSEEELPEEGLQEEELELDDEGYEWFTVFNEDGSMESVRIPVEEEEEIDESEVIMEPDAYMRILDRGIWSADSGMLNNQDNDDREISNIDSGTRSN
jgi:hypothetical protein